MNNNPPCKKRVTFAIQLADGTSLPVDMNPDSVQFVGGFSRLAAFGPLGARISARIVAQG
jgi:hypothetical protein